MVALAVEPQALKLSPFQRDLYWDDRRFVVGIGGRGSGKTMGITSALIGKIQRGEIPPGSRILVCGPSYPQLRMGTMKTFDELFDQTGFVLEKINGNEPERRLINNITVYFRNASNPEQTRGHGTVIVWLDEAGQMDDEVLRLTNMSNRQFGNSVQHQTYITTTPRGRNWLYRVFIDPTTKLYSDEKVGYYSTTTIEAQKHGVVVDDYVEESGYTPGTDQYRQEILGEFVTWSGLVFDQFDMRRHCPDPFVLPKFSRVYGGIDVGYSGITAISLTGITPQGGMYTFKEFHGKRSQSHEWMGLVGEWTTQYAVKRWYIDAAANIEYRAMKSANLPVYPSMKAKDAAGSAVGYINGKFARDELFIDRSACPFLVSEIETYQYKELMKGDEVTFLEKTKPNQPDDHADAWRYHLLPLSAANVQYGRSLEFQIA